MIYAIVIKISIICIVWSVVILIIFVLIFLWLVLILWMKCIESRGLINGLIISMYFRLVNGIWALWVSELSCLFDVNTIILCLNLLAWFILDIGLIVISLFLLIMWLFLVFLIVFINILSVIWICLLLLFLVCQFFIGWIERNRKSFLHLFIVNWFLLTSCCPETHPILPQPLLLVCRTILLYSWQIVFRLSILLGC